MSDRLTRNGAREVTETLDRIASVLQSHSKLLGINPKIALNFASRCDSISDAIETRASGNFPLKTANQFAPSIIGEKQSGPIENVESDEPFMDDHFTQKNFNELDAAQEDGDLGSKPYITKAGAKELTSAIDRVASVIQEHKELLGIGKKTATDFAYRCDLISDAVEKIAGAHFDPATIAEEVPGPLVEATGDDPKDAYMANHYKQDRFVELMTAQTTGKLGIPSYITKTFKAAAEIASAKNTSGLKVAVENLKKTTSENEVQGILDNLVQYRQKLLVAQTGLANAVTKVKGLEDDEIVGLATIKKVSAKLDAEADILLNVHRIVLQFSAAFPAVNLRDQIEETILDMFDAIDEDLDHVFSIFSALRVISKSAFVPAPAAKTAGLTDIVVSLKEWLAGKTDPTAQRLIKFTGDIGKWFKGMTERSKIVQSKAKEITDILAKAEKDYTAAAKTAAFHGFNLTK